MSIDRRMRDGLRRNADVLDPEVEEALRASRKRGARIRWGRRVTATGVAAVLVAAGVALSSVVQQSPVQVAGPPLFEGVWQTDTQSRSDLVARAIAQGADPTCASDFVGDTAATVRYTLAVNGDRWLLYRSDDGGELIGVEDGFWDVPRPGQIRLFAPNAPASYVFDSSIEPSSLRLDVRDLSLGGDPEACFVRAGSSIEFGAPFARVVDPTVALPSPTSEEFAAQTPSIQGTWTTALLTETELHGAIDAAGAGECADAVLGQRGDRRYILSIEGDRFVIHEPGQDDQALGAGRIDGGQVFGDAGRVGYRMSFPEPPLAASVWVQSSEDTLRLTVTELHVGSGDPSCESRARLAMWFGFPFSPAP